MKERDWLEKIRSSADEAVVPERLKPEQIEAMLKREKASGDEENSALDTDGRKERKKLDMDSKKELDMDSRKDLDIDSRKDLNIDSRKDLDIDSRKDLDIDSKKDLGIDSKKDLDTDSSKKEKDQITGKGLAFSRRRKVGLISGVSAAAAVLLLAGSYTAFQVMNRPQIRLFEQKAQAEDRIQMNAADSMITDGEAEDSAINGQEAQSDGSFQSESNALKIPQSESDAAPEPRRNAGDMFVLARDYQEVYDVFEKQLAYGNRMEEDLAVPEIEESINSGAQKESSYDALGSSVNSASDLRSKTDSGKLTHSTTNLQTEGVDESDIAKTDGSYIYAISGNKVVITDIRDGRLDVSGTIQLPADSADESVREMYVDEDRLVVITEGQKTSMDQHTGNSCYYIDSQIITAVYTYDISSRSKPVLLGKGTQEGNYNTSRKIGNMIYLFTQEMPAVAWMDSSEEAREDGSFIPLVNGQRIPADCIYIPEQGNSALIISSFYMDEPGEQADSIMIVNDGNNVYVSQDSIYLYGEDYAGNTTKIAKFSLGSRLNAVGAASVRGRITDTFAINEYRGSLRVLTTCSGEGQTSSSLYVLDQDLNVTGRLEGIAPGETVYAARYLGDIAYFVTYRNMDPLFAVDLSDVKDPVILGELKITGYSDYLHFWEEDKLLGIGYETDPDNGAVKGVKMAMFDISNPAEMKTIDSCVIENTSYTPAVNYYKASLVDTEANLIGYAVSGYQKGNRMDNYLLFEWKEGKFHSLLTETLSADIYTSDYRGIYAGRVFYLASPQGIISFNRDDEYKLLKSLDFALK